MMGPSNVGRRPEWIVPIIAKVSQVQVGVMQFRNALGVLEQSDSASGKDISQVEVGSSMSDDTGLCDLLHQEVFWVGHFVVLTQAPLAGMVNIAGSAHVQ